MRDASPLKISFFLPRGLFVLCPYNLGRCSILVGLSSQLAMFSALSRSFSAATFDFISAIIAASSLSHSSSVLV